MWAKIKLTFFNHEQKIVLALGLILVAGISFEAGVLKGHKIQEKPIIIEKPADVRTGGDSVAANTPQAQNLAQEAPKVSEGVNTQPQNCAFVGSKNSDKYHIPTCSSAKRIKPENLTCFKDENEAKSRGYLPDKGCIK